MYVNLKFENSKIFKFFVLCCRRSKAKWKMLLETRLENDNAAISLNLTLTGQHTKIYYIYIYYEHLCISPYIGGTHTIYHGVYMYICISQRTHPVWTKRKERKVAKKENDATQCILFYYYDHNIFVHVCTCAYYYMYHMYIQIVCRSGHSRFCWCQQRRRRKVFRNWTAFIGLGHAWAAADCFWVGIGTGRACVTLFNVNVKLNFLVWL